MILRIEKKYIKDKNDIYSYTKGILIAEDMRICGYELYPITNTYKWAWSLNGDRELFESISDYEILWTTKDYETDEIIINLESEVE